MPYDVGYGPGRACTARARPASRRAVLRRETLRREIELLRCRTPGLAGTAREFVVLDVVFRAPGRTRWRRRRSTRSTALLPQGSARKSAASDVGRPPPRRVPLVGPGAGAASRWRSGARHRASRLHLSPLDDELTLGEIFSPASDERSLARSLAAAHAQTSGCAATETSDLRKQVASALDEERKRVAKRAKRNPRSRRGLTGQARDARAGRRWRRSAARGFVGEAPRRPTPTRKRKKEPTSRRGTAARLEQEKKELHEHRDDGIVLRATKGADKLAAPRRDGRHGCE